MEPNVMQECSCKGPNYVCTRQCHETTVFPTVVPKTPTLYLDLDGVLADFDKRACEVLSGECHYRYDFIHGGDALWERLNGTPDFFSSFDLMPDAMLLWNAVWKLDPTILTALPTTGAEKVDQQKRLWVRSRFGSQVKVITCRTKDKPVFCQPGDILVDDRSVNKARWEAAGGTFILHTKALFTVAALKRLGVI